MRADCLFGESPSPLSSSENSHAHRSRLKLPRLKVLLAVFVVVIAVFSVVLVFQFVPTVQAAIALQPCSGKGTAFSGSTISVTLNATPTSGYVLILCSGWADSTASADISSVAETNVVWTSLGNPQAEAYHATGWYATVWWGNVGSSASTSITVTYGHANNGWGGCVDVYEFSGLQTTYGFLDNNASKDTTTGATLDTGQTATTSQLNELWVGCGFTNRGTASAAQTLDAGYTAYTMLDGANNQGSDGQSASDVSLSFLYRIVSSTGKAQCKTDVLASGNVMVGCMATFKAAATSSPDSVTLNSPISGTQTSLTVTFSYTPVLYEAIYSSSLYTNESGSWADVQDNSTAVSNNSANSFSHTLPSTAEGTVKWNVEVLNSSGASYPVWASSNATFTLDIPPRYQNAGSNATAISGTNPVSLYAQGYDQIGLSYAWLWTNQSGGTGTNYTSMTTTTASFTKYPSNPVMTPNATNWEGGVLGEQSILYINGVFDMWYRGYVTGVHSAIGFANSTDGITWTKYASNPIVAGDGAAWGLAFPNVIQVGSAFYMYAVNCTAGVYGNMSRWESSTVSNGGSWSLDNGGTPVLVDGTGAAWDYNIANDVIYYNATDSPSWHMIYEGLPNGGGPDQLGYAYSNDGLSWTKYGSNPVYSGPANTYAANPSKPILVGSNYYMWVSTAPVNKTTLVIQVIYSSTWTSWTLESNTAFYKTQSNEGSQISNPQVLDLTGQGLAHSTYMIYSDQKNFTLAYMDVSVANYTGSPNTVYTAPANYGAPANLANVANTWTWSNFTWTPPAGLAAGTVVQWQIFYNDTYGNTNGTSIGSLTNAFTASITVNTATHTWSVNPGDNNVTINENGGQISLTVTANAAFDIGAKASGDLTNGTNSISLTYTNMSASTWSVAIPLTTSYQTIPGLSNVGSGTDLSESCYVWLSCPTNVPAGAYTETVTFEIIQHGGSY